MILNKDKIFILINFNKYIPYDHIKIEEFITLMKSNPLIEFIEKLDIDDIKNLINNNLNNNYLFVFPFYIYHTCNIKIYKKFFEDMYNILLYINKLDNNIKLKFLFNSMDPVMTSISSNYLINLYSSSKPYINLMTLNMDDFKNLTKEYSYFKNKNFFFCPINYSYKLSQILFNNNPINKICLSGNIRNNVYTVRYNFNEIMKKYPEKYKLLEYNNNEISIKNNNFSLRLNKYIAAFYASHDLYHHSTPLHKIYEILSSGSLLVINEIDEKCCNLLGLINNKHMIVIKKNEIVINKVNYILDRNNINEINEIRKNGQHFCINNLNAEWFYKKYINIFKKIYDTL